MFGTFKHAFCQVAGDRWEASQEFFKRVVIFKILEERIHRHPCVFKDRNAPKDFRINGN